MHQTNTAPAPKRERGPKGSFAYEVELTTSDPGAKIEVKKEYVGDSPLKIKLYGDSDGTFHGGMDYVIRAYPVRPGQYQQVKVFSGGGRLGPEERIPKKIYFDMNSEPAPDKQQIDLNVNTKE